MQGSLLAPAAHAVGLVAVLPLLILVVALWTLVWKALALWHAARNRQKIWFLVLLIVNTVGILEIIYLKWYRKDGNGKGAPELFPFLKEWWAHRSSPAPKK